MSITGRFRQVVSFHGGRIAISTYETREMKDPNWLGPGGGEQGIRESRGSPGVTQQMSVRVNDRTHARINAYTHPRRKCDGVFNAIIQNKANFKPGTYVLTGLDLLIYLRW